MKGGGGLLDECAIVPSFNWDTVRVILPVLKVNIYSIGSSVAINAQSKHTEYDTKPNKTEPFDLLRACA